MSESILPGMGPKVISEKIEYRVREVKRYIITRYYDYQYEDAPPKKGSQSYGEFDNFHSADRVGRLCAMGESWSLHDRSTLTFTDALDVTIQLFKDGTSTPVDPPAEKG